MSKSFNFESQLMRFSGSNLVFLFEQRVHYTHLNAPVGMKRGGGFLLTAIIILSIQITGTTYLILILTCVVFCLINVK